MLAKGVLSILLKSNTFKGILDELPTWNNMKSSDCFEYGIDYYGNDLDEDYDSTDSANACQVKCQQTQGCNFWTWTPDYHNACWKKSSKGEVIPATQAVSGPAYCDNPNPDPTPGPDGPQGPPGVILKYDLLSNSQPGINYPNGHVGAFVPQKWAAGHVNHELQEYVPEAAVQNKDTNEITITAMKNNGRITSARLESYQVWSTAQSSDIKYHGYLEVRSTLPAKTNGWNFEGAWPAIWMLGTGNGQEWPRTGEIDIVEVINGNPTVYMSLHSTILNQHPPGSPYHLQNVDLSQDVLIAGFEWNLHDEQIDLTW